MKRILRVLLPVALLLMLAAPGAALAGGSTTDVEQKWIDFQKTVSDQMVKEGKMTRQDADKWMNDLKARFAESPGDSIYNMFAEKLQTKIQSQDGSKGGKMRVHGKMDDSARRVYAMLTGKTEDVVKKTCEDGGLTIWQLAKKEGKLDQLKAKLYDGQAAGLEQFVKGGIMSDQQRQKILQHIKGELDSK